MLVVFVVLAVLVVHILHGVLCVLRVALLLRASLLVVQMLHVLCNVRDLDEMIFFFPRTLGNEDTAVLQVAIHRTVSQVRSRPCRAPSGLRGRKRSTAKRR